MRKSGTIGMGEIGMENKKSDEALEDYIDNKEANEALGAIARGEDEFIPWEEAKKIIHGEAEEPEPKGADS